MDNNETRIKKAKNRVKKALEIVKKEIENDAKDTAWERHANEDARVVIKRLSEAKATTAQIEIAILLLQEKEPSEDTPPKSFMEIILLTAIDAASKTETETN